MFQRALVLFLFVSIVIASNYTKRADSCPYRLRQTWTGERFMDKFNFFTRGDPTHGHVKFVDGSTARKLGLISINEDNQVYMGVDKTNKAPNGRQAVRLESKLGYGYGMFILDLAHMPGAACGSWPAYWTVGDNWPNNGEIDIIEEVNRANQNQVTLHTGSGCQMNVARQMSGTATQKNCDVAATGNAGCGVRVNKAGSYGDGFNQQGGGVYVMERTTENIRVWYFARNEIPADLLGTNPDPCSWGLPVADFPTANNCNKSKFGPQKFVFDITFCGDWAGVTFSRECPNMGSCKDYVSNNPQAFAQSYWLINSLRILIK